MMAKQGGEAAAVGAEPPYIINSLAGGKARRWESNWKGLPWIPVGCRTFQGPQPCTDERCQEFIPSWRSSKSLDPGFTPEMLDSVPPVWSCRATTKDGQDRQDLAGLATTQSPRIVQCLNDSLESSITAVIWQSVSKKSWRRAWFRGKRPKSSGRPHNYFITMPPWSANMRKDPQISIQCALTLRSWCH